jgi:hypothetical protein
MNKAHCGGSAQGLYPEGARTAAFLTDIFGGFPRSIQADSRIMS